MHCLDWEERVALHVGGDLPAAEAAPVEQHLAGCADCQVFWSGMKESLELIQGAHAEVLPQASYTAVRARVLAELDGRRAWWRGGWFYGAAAVALALLVVLAVWPGLRVKPLPRMAVAGPPAPVVVTPVAARREAATNRGRRKRTPRQPQQLEPRRPLLVRLVTNDPNVVIYWIAE